MVNIYRTTFTRQCPTKPDVWVSYSLEIHSRKTIMVEDISRDVNGTVPCFHEELADVLHERYGGLQIMRGHHHGVDIETQRGELEPCAS